MNPAILLIRTRHSHCLPVTLAWLQVPHLPNASPTSPLTSTRRRRVSPCFWAECCYERVCPARGTEEGFTSLFLFSKHRLSSTPDSTLVTPSAFHLWSISALVWSSCCYWCPTCSCWLWVLALIRQSLTTGLVLLTQSLDIWKDSPSGSHASSVRSLVDSGVGGGRKPQELHLCHSILAIVWYTYWDARCLFPWILTSQS